MGKLSRKKPLKYPLNAARMPVDASESGGIGKHTSGNFRKRYKAKFWQVKYC